MLTSVGAGTATIGVTATDPRGLSATASFTVTVAGPATFTDDPIRPGATPVRVVHFAELRARIDALRRRAPLAPFAWTDPVLTPGVTPVRREHLLELREALAAACAASGRPAPRWTDAAPTAGTPPIRAAHLMELRAAVLVLERVCCLSFELGVDPQRRENAAQGGTGSNGPRPGLAGSDTPTTRCSS